MYGLIIIAKLQWYVASLSLKFRYGERRSWVLCRSHGLASCCRYRMCRLLIVQWVAWCSRTAVNLASHPGGTATSVANPSRLGLQWVALLGPWLVKPHFWRQTSLNSSANSLDAPLSYTKVVQMFQGRSVPHTISSQRSHASSCQPEICSGLVMSAGLKLKTLLWNNNDLVVIAWWPSIFLGSSSRVAGIDSTTKLRCVLLFEFWCFQNYIRFCRERVIAI
jgi:hypothetical protein